LLTEAKLMNLLKKGVGYEIYLGFPELIWFGEEH